MTSVKSVQGVGERQDVFRGLAESSQDAIVIETLTGEITFWNTAARRLYGYTEAEAIGCHIGILLPPDLREEDARLLERIARGECVDPYESRRLTRHGNALDVDVCLSPISADDGSITGVCSVMRDITERKRAEARSDELAVLVESSQDAILIETLSGGITFWNRAAERLYLYAAPETIGQHVEMLIPPELKDEEAGLLKRIARGEQIDPYETRRLTRDGRALDIDVSLWPIRSRNGSITGVCSVMRDITDRKRAEQELSELYAQQRHIGLALRLMGSAEQIPSVQAASRYLPSTQGQGVGGDWLDLIDLGAGRVGVVVGDVMGRGLDAAVVMGQLRSAARALALAGVSGCELMQALDKFTCGLGEQFVTCVYLEVDPARGELTVCSAGHLPVLHIAPDGTIGELPVPTGIPLGVGGVPHQQVSLPLRAGASLALYTDGLVETPHSDIEVQLKQMMATLGEVFADAPGLERAADRILETMLPGSAAYADDVTLLLLDFPAAPLDTVERRFLKEPASVPPGRDFLRAALRRWGLSALEDTALLLVSELMTNAVRHARGPLDLRVWYSARELSVEVTDRSTPRPWARLADSDEESGRGLVLVEALADAWGSRPCPRGKTVWFTLLTCQD